HATIQFECSKSQLFVCTNGCCFESSRTLDCDHDQSHDHVHDHNHDHIHNHGHSHKHIHDHDHGHQRVVIACTNSYANGGFAKRKSHAQIRTVRVRLEPLDERVSQLV